MQRCLWVRGGCGRGRGLLKGVLLFILLMLGEQSVSRREVESMALLEKLIRLDSKDCNFHFKDLVRGLHFKVSYPLTNTDNNSNEGLLKQLWHHIWAHYFKKLDHEELRRFEYVESLFSATRTPNNGTSHFLQTIWNQDTGFSGHLQALLSHSYLDALLAEAETDRETELWLKGLYLTTKAHQLEDALSKEDRRKTKFIYSKIKDNRKHRQRIKNKKMTSRTIREDHEAIDELLLELREEEMRNGSEIEREIMRLQEELAENAAETKPYLQALEGKIRAEREGEENGFYRNFMTNSSEYSQDNLRDLECLEYLIRCLEEKQIAESVAKITSTQRSKGETLFQLAFEKAINMQPRLVTEKQLSRINFLRETSLIQFYRTGVKSLYSYICHNYVGFRELMQSRQNITARLKDKCIMQMMKKGAYLASIAEIQAEMIKFNTCHHCKFLYPDYLLFTCSFTSDKQAIPKVNLGNLGDPNLAETFQQGPSKSRSSQRFMTRKKNCLTSYAKIHDEYVCGRKYCFSCLKDTYSHQNIRENGLCPFCLGVCICTRCLRNEKIAKFKSMYALLGGDLGKIQEGSELEQMQVKGELEVAPRGRGRPKKYATGHLALHIAQTKLRRLKEDIRPAPPLRKPHTLWKGKQAANDTQDSAHPLKAKRGVGRPRLNRPREQHKRGWQCG